MWQRGIDALKLGEAWLATFGNYEKISFPPYKPRGDMVVEELPKE